MKSRLTEEEWSTLRTLDGMHDLGKIGIDTAVSPRLYDFGMAMLDPSRGPRIGPRGKQALFQRRCREALHSLAEGDAELTDPDVIAWLTRCEFVVRPHGTPAFSKKYSMTRRGRTWLEEIDGP